MLQELIMELLAGWNDPKLKEKAYRNLERVGVDRYTANVIAKEFNPGGMLHGEIRQETD